MIFLICTWFFAFVFDFFLIFCWLFPDFLFLIFLIILKNVYVIFSSNLPLANRFSKSLFNVRRTGTDFPGTPFSNIIEPIGSLMEGNHFPPNRYFSIGLVGIFRIIDPSLLIRTFCPVMTVMTGAHAWKFIVSNLSVCFVNHLCHNVGHTSRHVITWLKGPKISGPVENHFRECGVELSINCLALLCVTSRSTLNGPLFTSQIFFSVLSRNTFY